MIFKGDHDFLFCGIMKAVNIDIFHTDIFPMHLLCNRHVSVKVSLEMK